MKKIVIFVLISMMMFPALPVFAFSDEETLEHLLNVEMVNYNVPGLLVSIVKDGEVLYENAFGEADVTTKTNMDVSRSIIQVGSISKVITTHALLTLLEEKNISVDSEIGSYLPDYLSENAYLKGLTFRNLLTHTTGIATVKANSAIQENPILGIKDSFSEQAQQFFDRYKLEPVLEKDQYTIFSNVGYILSGVLIESISGERFEHHLSTGILSSLDMTASSELIMGRSIIGAELVQNYAVYGGRRTPLAPFSTRHIASDDFLTTLNDMTNLMKSLTHLEKESPIYDAMFTRQIANNALISGRSFGFSVIRFGKYDAYLHDGGIPGENARLLFIPELKIGVFLSYNNNSLVARERFTEVVLSDIIDNYDSKEGHESYAIEDLTKFEGAYSPVNASNETLEQLTKVIHQIRIKAQSDALLIDDEVYYPISETIFYNEAYQNYAEFRTDDDGQLEYLIVGNAIYERTPIYQSLILGAAMLIAMGLLNLLAWLTLLTKWSNLKVNRIHDTPRFVLLAHTIIVSGVLAFILIISSSYDIWDVIYGINNAVNGTRLFGIAALVMTVPAWVMVQRAKQDYRWSPVTIGIFQFQILLGLLTSLWMWIYNLI